MYCRYLAKGFLTLCISSCVLGVLLSGCLADKEAELKPAKETTLQCDRLSNVVIETKPEVNELNITADQISSVLFPKIDEICGKFDKQYALSVHYETKLDEVLSTTKLTAKETKTAIVRVVLNLVGSNQEYTFNGAAQLEASGKKLLDIGESVQINSKDEAMLIDQAAQASINEAKKVFKKDIELE